MRIGFRGNDLAALEILDSFGQRSVLTFNKMEVNAGVSPDAFHFKPPQGADVREAVSAAVIAGSIRNPLRPRIAGQARNDNSSAFAASPGTSSRLLDPSAV